MEDYKKIIVAGLDNAGKTSIIDVVLEKMVEPLSTIPTKGIERSQVEILGQKIVIHDFGGQKKYKDEYLKNKELFTGTDTLLYVLDLQDNTRYDLALDYYTKVLDMLVDLSISVPVHVFLHKFDGNYLKDYEDKTTRTALELEQLKDEFQRIASEHQMVVDGIFQTTVESPFDCFSAFNAVWSSVVPKITTMEEFLGTLLFENPEIGVALILDEEANVIAKKIQLVEGIDSAKMVDIAAKSVIVLLDWQDTIKSRNIDGHDFAVLDIDDQTIMIQKLALDVGTLYLMVFASGGDYKMLQTRFAGIAYTLESML